MDSSARRLGLGQRAELRCGLQLQSGLVVQRHVQTPQLACCWVLRGSGTIAYDGRLHTVEPGDVFQRLPGQVHEVRMNGPTEWLFVAVPAGCHQALCRVSPRTAQLPVLHIGRDALLLRRWKTQIERLRRFAEAELASSLTELFALVAELHRRAAVAGHDPWVEQAGAELASSLLPVSAVAARLGLSASAFRARFTAAAGVSPRTWRIRQRIAQAQELLADSSLDLATVAERLGYPDLPTFAKQFRVVAGQPPGQWRMSQA